MRRLTTVMATVVVAIALATANTGQARAMDREWCAEDPVFTVLDATFSLTTYIHAPASSVSVAYTLEVPENAGNVRVSYPGGQTVPTTVLIRYTQPDYSGGDGSFHVLATVTVTGPSGSQIRTKLGGDTVPRSFTGTTDRPLTFGFDVAPR